jgi:hypothetical protein
VENDSSNQDYDPDFADDDLLELPAGMHLGSASFRVATALLKGAGDHA